MGALALKPVEVTWMFETFFFISVYIAKKLECIIPKFRINIGVSLGSPEAKPEMRTLTGVIYCGSVLRRKLVRVGKSGQQRKRSQAWCQLR